MNNKYINIFFFVANLRGYTKNEAEAANVYHDRKHRLAHPPGSWDKAGRFYPDEDSKHLDGTRPPSRSWPLSYNSAARNAKHVGEVFGARNTVNVNRLCKIIENEYEFYDAVDDVMNALNANRSKDERINLLKMDDQELSEYGDFLLKNQQLRTLLKPASKRLDFVSEEEIARIEEEERQARAATPVTSPPQRKPMINPKKKLKPLKVAVEAGFRPQPLKGGGVVAYYRVPEGYLVLKAKNGKNITLAANAELVLTDRISDGIKERKIMDIENVRMTGDAFKSELEKVLNEYVFPTEVA